jgi:hypothetical protein
MHIELLWLVPVIAFAAFLFFLALYAQRRAETRTSSGDLSREVELFNSGSGQQKLVTAKSTDDRLHEMEKMINRVAEVVANQQHPLHEFRKGIHPSEGETIELREKLRTVFGEYDIVLSENYTLRAKVKQLTGQIKDLEADGGSLPKADSILTNTATAASKPSLHLYEDTRLINLAALDSDELPESDNSIAR